MQLASDHHSGCEGRNEKLVKYVLLIFANCVILCMYFRSICMVLRMQDVCNNYLCIVYLQLILTHIIINAPRQC